MPSAPRRWRCGSHRCTRGRYRVGAYCPAPSSTSGPNPLRADAARGAEVEHGHGDGVNGDGGGGKKGPATV
eukprot:9818818-Heterocapsa_arctica.AAC.1